MYDSGGALGEEEFPCAVTLAWTLFETSVYEAAELEHRFSRVEIDTMPSSTTTIISTLGSLGSACKET